MKYATLLHELSHSTAHGSRLSRKGITDAVMFDSHEYSPEELIADMGSAFLARHCGIDTNTLASAAAYVPSRLHVLNGDKRIVVVAAAEAQKAADLFSASSTADERQQITV
jgi:antirestriction protein ArdC